MTSRKKSKRPKYNADDTERKRNQNPERLVELLKLISDDNSVLIFNTVFLAGGDSSESLRTELKLSRKQFYSRISRLIRIGLVKRQKGKYFVTAFGRVIYDAQKLLGNALKNYWKLSAIESLGVAHDSSMPEAERTKIIDLMIGNQQIKEILMSNKYLSPT
jgi:DNA-binding HxlR family transcriptional regulator